MLAEDYPVGCANTYIYPRSHLQTADWLAATDKTPTRERTGGDGSMELPDLPYEEPAPISGLAGDVIALQAGTVHTASRNITDGARKVLFLNFTKRDSKSYRQVDPGSVDVQREWRAVLRSRFPAARRHILGASGDGGTVRVGAVQMISTGADPDGNLAKAERFARDAHRAGVKILCFPECASTSFDWVAGEANPTSKPCPRAELVPGGPSVELFVALAAELDMYMIFGCVEREEGSNDLFNTAFVCGPSEGYIGKFRKVTSETEFVDGTEAPLFETRYGTLGIFICSDMRLPELARLLVLKGAQMVSRRKLQTDLHMCVGLT